MKACVYTCVTGGYDTVAPYVRQHSTIDFICFTDNPNMKSNGWIIRPIPEDLKHLSLVKQQRLIKILPHKYLKEYDVSVWIDGNIHVLCDVAQFLDGFDFDSQFFYTRIHPCRNCIYKEAEKCLDMKKGNPDEIRTQMKKYREEGFPCNYGLYETCIVVRFHNKRECILLDNLWATELIQGCHRDQLCFNYCLWKLNMKIGDFDIGKMNKNNKFKWVPHG